MSLFYDIGWDFNIEELRSSFLEFRSSIDFRLVLVALRSLCLGALYMLCDEFHLGSSKSFVEKKIIRLRGSVRVTVSTVLVTSMKELGLNFAQDTEGIVISQLNKASHPPRYPGFDNKTQA